MFSTLIADALGVGSFMIRKEGKLPGGIISKEYDLEYCSSISFKEDSNHNPKLLEINPRLGNSTALSRKGGLKYPYICVKKALGEKKVCDDANKRQ